MARTRRKPRETGRTVGSFPSNPYRKPRKLLADRPLYPWSDHASAFRIVTASTRAAAKQNQKRRRRRR